MREMIPTLKAENILKIEKNISANYFFLENDIHPINLNLPHRSDCYFISICLAGKAEITANITKHKIEKNTLITLAPLTVKSLNYISKDYKKLAVLFTKDFIIKNNTKPNFLDDFIFFNNYTNHVLELGPTESILITESLRKVQTQINSNHCFKDDIVRSLVNILLLEVSNVYKGQIIPENKLTRSEQITCQFQKLVLLHFREERGVRFYADLLFISPKHLTETIKYVVGKSAGDYIDEIIILEAKVLLQNAALSIANISDMLNFTDQATFGRFFKNNTGMSPLGYKQISK